MDAISRYYALDDETLKPRFVWTFASDRVAAKVVCYKGFDLYKAIDLDVRVDNSWFPVAVEEWAKYKKVWPLCKEN